MVSKEVECPLCDPTDGTVYCTRFTQPNVHFTVCGHSQQGAGNWIQCPLCQGLRLVSDMLCTAFMLQFPLSSVREHDEICVLRDRINGK